MNTLSTVRFIEAIETGPAMLDTATGHVIEPGTRQGYAVPVPGSAVRFGFHADATAVSDAITAMLSRTDAADTIVNGWYHPDAGYVIELATVHRVDRGTALLIADIRGTEGIVDIATNADIVLPATPVAA